MGCQTTKLFMLNSIATPCCCVATCMQYPTAVLEFPIVHHTIIMIKLTGFVSCITVASEVAINNCDLCVALV